MGNPSNWNNVLRLHTYGGTPTDAIPDHLLDRSRASALAVGTRRVRPSFLLEQAFQVKAVLLKEILRFLPQLALGELGQIRFDGRGGV